MKNKWRKPMMQKPKEGPGGCCRVEALISVDERGQMVLPKEVREAAGIRAGDKLALILWRKGARVCCMSLVKAEELTGMVKSRLGPLMKDIIS
jgi:AbrB family looped-hinge helix DNA binding protein